MRAAATVAAMLFALLGVGAVVPGLSGTAAACACAFRPTEPIPSDLVVISGVVEKQTVGDREVDLQVRVSSMHGARPERVTVIRAASGRYSSCGDDYDDGREVRMVVERGGPRWVHPICANVVLDRADAPAFTGIPPGPDAEEHCLAGPPMSWLRVAAQSYWTVPSVVALAMVVGLGLVVVLARKRRG